MRSKRYFAEDLRSAVLKVRRELGPNAVILAHHRNESGVEVTAAPGDDVASCHEIWRPEISDETLDVKNVRDSYDNSIQGNVQFYNSVDKEVKQSSDSNTDVAANVKVNVGIADRETATSTGESLMQSQVKSSNSRLEASSIKSSGVKPVDPVEHDFEAEMDTILNTHYVSLDANKKQLSQQQSEPKSSQKSAAPRKKHSLKHKRSESKVHTALSKLKISSEEKQTVVRSSKAETSDPLLPPVLTASFDHDEMVESIELQMGEHAYGEAARKNPVRANLIRQLMKLDLSPFIVQRVVNTLVSDKVNQKMLLPQAMALIANQIPIYKEDISSTGGTVALFGGTGVGKTTTIAKLAARYALKQGSEKVALITTDDNRIAATEQLRTYSNILGIPLRIARNDIEVLNALNTFSDKEFVLIDTAGMSPNELKKSKFYDLFAGGITQIKKFQVLPATMNRAALEKTTSAFSEFGLHGSIISKVDETTSLGGAISVAIQHNLPVAFYGNGQTVPDDFHLARAHILMSQVLDVTKQFDEQESDEVSGETTSGLVNNANF